MGGGMTGFRIGPIPIRITWFVRNSHPSTALERSDATPCSTLQEEFSVTTSSRFCTCLLLAAVSLFSVTLNAQDTERETDDEKAAWPVLTINLASINRARGHVEFLFDLIERPEISDLFNAQLANFRDLKGINHDSPAGLMIFLSEGLVPLPIPVAYLPVSDIGELTQTVATVGAQIDAVPNEEGFYELTPRNGVKQHIMLHDGYAYIGASFDSVDRDFARPEAFAGGLSNRYDISISANLAKTSKSVRQLVLATIRASSQASMQQRDNEPVAAYEIRRAGAESNFRFVENLLSDGEEVTLGFKVDPIKQHAYLDLTVRAAPDSDFAAQLLEATGTPSYFHAAIDETVPMSLSYSANLAEADRKTFLTMVKFGEPEVNRGVAELPADTLPEDVPQLETIRSLFSSLQATIKAGHLDGFVQMFGEPPEKFVLLGGVKLVDAGGFGVGVSDLLERARKSESNTDIELSVASHGDIVFHRLTGREEPNQRDRRLFGDKPALYVGAGNEAVWFAVGGDEAIPTLKAIIDKVAASQASPPPIQETKPFQFVLNMNHFVRMRNLERENPDNQNPRRGNRGRFGEMALEAFSEAGSDVLRVDARAIENGFRVRMQVENGFLRLLGSMIAGRIDRSQDL